MGVDSLFRSSLRGTAAKGGIRKQSREKETPGGAIKSGEQKNRSADSLSARSFFFSTRGQAARAPSPALLARGVTVRHDDLREFFHQSNQSKLEHVR